MITAQSKTVLLRGFKKIIKSFTLHNVVNPQGVDASSTEADAHTKVFTKDIDPSMISIDADENLVVDCAVTSTDIYSLQGEANTVWNQITLSSDKGLILYKENFNDTLLYEGHLLTLRSRIKFLDLCGN